MKVLTFSIGFGSPIYEWRTKSGIRCIIGSIPLGGYVQMLDERVEQVAKAERHLAYNNQSILRRLIIVLAGPAANFLLAILCFWFTLMLGVEGIAPIVGAVHEGSIAEAAGLRPLDEIIAVSGTPTPTWNEVSVRVSHLLAAEPEQPATVPHDNSQQVTVALQVKNQSDGAIRDLALYLPSTAMPGIALLHRIGLLTQLEVLPAVVGEINDNSAASNIDLQPGDTILAIDEQNIVGWYELVDTVGKMANQSVILTIARPGSTELLKRKVQLGQRQLADGSTIGVLGVKLAQTSWPAGAVRRVHYGAIPGFGIAMTRTKDLSVATLSMIWKMLVGQSDTANLGGPIAIAKGAGQSAQGGLEYYLAFIGLISISLGVINLLPIPMLDGGHVLFLLVEALRGQPLSDEMQMLGVKVGIVILIMVMGLALFNDFSSIISSG